MNYHKYFFSFIVFNDQQVGLQQTQTHIGCNIITQCICAA